MDDLRSRLTGRWMHSHEEDTADVAVYRPASYDFPPARGRNGFEFSADGRATYIGIAATDGSNQIPGRWELDAPNRVRVTDGGRAHPADVADRAQLRRRQADGAAIPACLRAQPAGAGCRPCVVSRHLADGAAVAPGSCAVCRHLAEDDIDAMRVRTS